MSRPEELLKRLAGPEAQFREHQLEAVTDLVDDRARVLCVQRTGWGKSAVYFLATSLLRERGAGPALIVSPLLALMRNQIAAAESSGSARTRSTAPTATPGTKCARCSPRTASTCC